MSVIRHYIMTAAEGRADDLAKGLATLGDALKQVAGFEGAQLLHDQDDANRFYFLERWETVDAHKSALKSLPKEAMGGWTSALGAPPEGRYLDVL